MSDSAFKFVLSLIAAGYVLVAIQWWWERRHRK